MGARGCCGEKFMTSCHWVQFWIYQVKHPTAVDSINDGRAVLYRSKIDHNDAEISPLYHFSVGGRGRNHANMTQRNVVPFGEIEVNPSDLKHVM